MRRPLAAKGTAAAGLCHNCRHGGVDEKIEEQGRVEAGLGLRVYTIGHSTRPIEEFIQMLKAHAVARLVDVRTVPGSRHNPQYNQEYLSSALERYHLHYLYMAGLGGFRHARKGATENLGWRNLSFLGYADYMQTPKFEHELQHLIAAARIEQIAIMCAEAVPWRCHRSLIADALLVRGIEVQEITSATKTKPFILHHWAHVDGTEVTYPDLLPEPIEPSH
jgi:uncharacterized protein (DUF488 family)